MASVSEWQQPHDLEPPKFEGVTPRPACNCTGSADAGNKKEPPPQEAASEAGSGLDIGTLLPLLGAMGGGDNNLSPLLGLLNGEKPDIMSLVPLLTSLIAKKEPAPKPAPERTINLEDYARVK